VMSCKMRFQSQQTRLATTMASPRSSVDCGCSIDQSSIDGSITARSFEEGLQPFQTMPHLRIGDALELPQQCEPDVEPDVILETAPQQCEPDVDEQREQLALLICELMDERCSKFTWSMSRLTV